MIIIIFRCYWIIFRCYRWNRTTLLVNILYVLLFLLILLLLFLLLLIVLILKVLILWDIYPHYTVILILILICIYIHYISKIKFTNLRCSSLMRWNKSISWKLRILIIIWVKWRLCYWNMNRSFIFLSLIVSFFFF